MNDSNRLTSRCRECGDGLAEFLARRLDELADQRRRAAMRPVELAIPEAVMVMFGLHGTKELDIHVKCGVLPEPVLIEVPGKRTQRRWVLAELVAAADKLIAQRDARLLEQACPPGDL